MSLATADPQRQPHGRHDARLRGDQAATAAPGCPTTRSSIALHRLGRPELRRVRAARHHADARRRRERLRRQGAVGRQADRLSAEGVDVRAPRRTSSSATSRSTARPAARRTSAASPASGSRAQQRRARRRRGRRRPRLRVHDRRPRRRARPDRAELRRRHERRHRLRARRDRRLRSAAATSRWSTSSRSTTRGRSSSCSDLIARHVQLHRQRLRGAAARATGSATRRRFVKVMPRDYKRVLAGGGGSAERADGASSELVGASGRRRNVDRRHVAPESN